MEFNNRCGFNSYSVIGVIVAIVFGALIGVLFSLALIPFIVTLVWIVFGMAAFLLIVFIAALFITSNNESSALHRCFRKNAIFFLVGILGTIIFAIVALSITLTTTLILVITFIAILAFFFALMLAGLICLINCILSRMNDR